MWNHTNRILFTLWKHNIPVYCSADMAPFGESVPPPLTLPHSRSSPPAPAPACESYRVDEPAPYPQHMYTGAGVGYPEPTLAQAPGGPTCTPAAPM